jgi:pSer/pThr/pTyr-binding forkhead associated (FHA) protein
VPPQVAAAHFITGSEAYLLDLNSLNGTLVNGVLLEQEKRLFPGDLIQIGPLVFELRLPSPQTVAVKQPAIAGQSRSSSEIDLYINLPANDGDSRPTDKTTDSHPSLPAPR